MGDGCSVKFGIGGGISIAFCARVEAYRFGFGEAQMIQHQLPPAKVLIIDDEPSNVRLLERVLALFGGLTWCSTTDPRQAVSLFAEFAPDIVLTDLHMPYLDGYQVMEQLRQLIEADNFLPIVMLTADISPETRRQALRAGGGWAISWSATLCARRAGGWAAKWEPLRRRRVTRT